jgi:trimethylamine--corrinoid protein Co-methyltransferase
VIHQLKRPGAPFIFGGMASLMDMHSTVFSYGAPEFQAGNTMRAEMAYYFGLPNFGTAGTSDAQCLDGQAIIEALSSCMLAQLSGTQLVHDIGLLGSATLVSPEMIVASNEILELLAHMFSEGQPDAESLSLDLFKEAHERGEFLSHAYTLQHFHEIWYPALFYRHGAKHWQDGASLPFEKRLTARTQELIRDRRPAALPNDLAQAIWKIIPPG